MKRPFAHIGFTLAISLIIVNLIPFEIVKFVMVGLAILFVASLMLCHIRKSLSVPICIGTALFACFIFIVSVNLVVAPQQTLDDKTVDASFYIISTEETNNNEYIYVAKTDKINDDDAPQNIKFRLKSDIPINAEPYQIINGKLKFYNIGDAAFDSWGYWGNNIFLSSRVKNFYVTDKNISSPWKTILVFRNDIINTLYKNMPNDSGGLSIALLTGYKNYISNSLRLSFKYANASHLMAVSGYHLMIIVGAALFIMKKARFNDKISALITITLVLGFIGVAGFSKSVIRSGVMIIAMLLGKLFNRHIDGLNSLGLAVAVICINPFAVCDISAQLSVASALSLITMSPMLENKIKNKWLKTILLDFIIALSVLVFNVPIMYNTFGYINLSGLLSSIFVSFVGGICIVFSIITYFVLKLNLFTTAISFICSLLTNALIKIVYAFGSIRFLIVDITGIFGLIIVAITVLFIICFFIPKLKLVKPVGIFSTAVVTILIIFSVVVNYNSAQVLVTKNGAVAVNYKGETVVCGLADKNDYYSINRFLFKNNSSINTLIIGDDEQYSLKLVEDYGCKNIVSSYFCNDALNCDNYDTYTVWNGYIQQDNDIKIKMFDNNEKTCCLLGVKNATIAVGCDNVPNCDLVICDDKIIDNKDTIKLDEEDIIYTIYNDLYVQKGG